MQGRQRHSLLLLGLFALSLTALPATADAARVNPELAYFSDTVEVIEGEHVRNLTPPVPRLYGDVSLSHEDHATADIATMIMRTNRQLDPQFVAQVAQNIHILSRNYNIDPKLIASLVAVESSFRPSAVSSSGAIGLGQLKPETAKWLGVNDPYDPADNLMGVAKYLRFLLNRYNGSVQHALAAYFQGQGTIDRQGINDSAQYYIGKVNKVFSHSF